MNDPATAIIGTILDERSRTWLVTGVGGFIGSNILEALLRHGQYVVGLDNFATGKRDNLADVEASVGDEAWSRFRFHEADIRDLDACRAAMTFGEDSDGQTRNVETVLHNAAIGSVPRSIDNPIYTHENNINGFLNMLCAAREAGVGRFVYASSSSVYGDNQDLPKVEEHIGTPLSPYAITKRTNEMYAAVFTRCYGMETVGLRYFNVFGKRQDPDGAYAAVIPKWISSFISGTPIHINGDGETSRDFCYIANVVQANIRAATVEKPDALNRIYNVGAGGRTTLNDLFAMIRDALALRQFPVSETEPEYRDFRPGDVRHSLAEIASARALLGYRPTHTVSQGMDEALDWYIGLSRRG